MAAANVRRRGTGSPGFTKNIADGFTKNIASCDFFLAGFRPLVLRPASCRAVFWHRYGRGAARAPRAGVADKRSQDGEA